MKKQLLIAVFGAIFFVGIVMALNREPVISAGVLSVITGKTETPIQGTEVETLHSGKKTEKTHSFDIQQIAGDCKAFEQTVEKNTGNQSVKQNSDMSVGFSGRYCDDIKYSVYETDGTVINKDTSKLELPTKDIDSCVVKVDVKWGREKNYREFFYFFRIDFKKSE